MSTTDLNDLVDLVAALPADDFHRVMVATMARRAMVYRDAEQTAMAMNAIIQAVYAARVKELDTALFDLETATVKLNLLNRRDYDDILGHLRPHRRLWRARIIEGIEALAAKKGKGER